MQTKYKISNGCRIFSQKIYLICNEFYSLDDLDNYEVQLERAIEKECKNENLLTAKEIKSIRKKYNLTQLQMKLLLKIGPKNVSKWETYKSNQSSIIDKLQKIK